MNSQKYTITTAAIFDYNPSDAKCSVSIEIPDAKAVAAKSAAMAKGGKDVKISKAKQYNCEYYKIVINNGNNSFIGSKFSDSCGVLTSAKAKFRSQKDKEETKTEERIKKADVSFTPVLPAGDLLPMMKTAARNTLAELELEDNEEGDLTFLKGFKANVFKLHQAELAKQINAIAKSSSRDDRYAAFEQIVAKRASETAIALTDKEIEANRVAPAQRDQYITMYTNIYLTHIKTSFVLMFLDSECAKFLMSKDIKKLLKGVTEGTRFTGVGQYYRRRNQDDEKSDCENIMLDEPIFRFNIPYKIDENYPAEKDLPSHDVVYFNSEYLSDKGEPIPITFATGKRKPITVNVNGNQVTYNPLTRDAIGNVITTNTLVLCELTFDMSKHSQGTSLNCKTRSVEIITRRRKQIVNDEPKVKDTVKALAGMGLFGNTGTTNDEAESESEQEVEDAQDDGEDLDGDVKSPKKEVKPIKVEESEEEESDEEESDDDEDVVDEKPAPVKSGRGRPSTAKKTK